VEDNAQANQIHMLEVQVEKDKEENERKRKAQLENEEKLAKLKQQKLDKEHADWLEAVKGVEEQNKIIVQEHKSVVDEQRRKTLLRLEERAIIVRHDIGALIEFRTGMQTPATVAGIVIDCPLDTHLQLGCYARKGTLAIRDLDEKKFGDVVKEALPIKTHRDTWMAIRLAPQSGHFPIDIVISKMAMHFPATSGYRIDPVYVQNDDPETKKFFGIQCIVIAYPVLDWEMTKPTESMEEEEEVEITYVEEADWEAETGKGKTEPPEKPKTGTQVKEENDSTQKRKSSPHVKLPMSRMPFLSKVSTKDKKRLLLANEDKDEKAQKVCHNFFEIHNIGEILDSLRQEARLPAIRGKAVLYVGNGFSMVTSLALLYPSVILLCIAPPSPPSGEVGWLDRWNREGKESYFLGPRGQLASMIARGSTPWKFPKPPQPNFLPLPEDPYKAAGGDSQPAAAAAVVASPHLTVEGGRKRKAATDVNSLERGELPGEEDFLDDDEEEEDDDTKDADFQMKDGSDESDEDDDEEEEEDD